MMIPYRKFFLTVVCFLIVAGPAAAIDRVTFTPSAKNDRGKIVKLPSQTIEGRTLHKYRGGRLMQTADGRLWIVPSSWNPSVKSDNRPFKPLTADELAESVKKELPPGFQSFKTKHYVILYSTSRVYAQWCGSLFERLYMAFQNFWRRKGFKLKEPEFPLVAIVFENQNDYINHAYKELGLTKEQTKSVIGFYNIKTNRMVMSDLTNTSGIMAQQKGTAAQINHILSQPRAATLTSTIVHEATHQIAHNCGIHARLADNPLWFVEGLALYFETPDLSSSKGWRGIGNLNPTRMRDFINYVRKGRPGNSIETLLRDGKRIHDLSLAQNGYAEAWALTYFLAKQRPKEYVKYVKEVCDKPPFLKDSPEKRVKTFTDIFGDLDKLDQEFMRYMSKQ